MSGRRAAAEWGGSRPPPSKAASQNASQRVPKTHRSTEPRPLAPQSSSNRKRMSPGGLRFSMRLGAKTCTRRKWAERDSNPWLIPEGFEGSVKAAHGATWGLAGRLARSPRAGVLGGHGFSLTRTHALGPTKQLAGTTEFVSGGWHRYQNRPSVDRIIAAPGDCRQGRIGGSGRLRLLPPHEPASARACWMSGIAVAMSSIVLILTTTPPL